MNQCYNRDVKYSFLRRCIKPIHTSLIDEEWIKEKNIEMEIIIPFKNMDGLDEDLIKNGNNLINWNDVGMEEILGKNLSLSDFNYK